MPRSHPEKSLKFEDGNNFPSRIIERTSTFVRSYQAKNSTAIYSGPICKIESGRRLVSVISYQQRGKHSSKSKYSCRQICVIKNRAKVPSRSKARERSPDSAWRPSEAMLDPFLFSMIIYSHQRPSAERSTISQSHHIRQKYQRWISQQRWCAELRSRAWWHE